ncbi:uncharacterized protein J4E84_009813 [Alternaria hordeiaustralica]|uniref:uncharacterized protein n=1 Tax=Alternaria hordeiaustralica TaxID=1187925 RepID=UPI0020C56815|nr:uncharacterized protein J4E84_009813 [Alternaria hordeiaustralica]KAI4676014.1 hypothetical protein J4E84_009813 [Alternaria hordeiaustralica]
MTAPFKPKQALDFDGALLQELQGDVSDTIAQQVLEELPPLTATSVVHDNGCGPGAVTMAMMRNNPPADNLTDNPSWPFKVETMDACNLTFPDNTFDYSFTNFVFAGLSDDGGAASHILRTLKPVGTGVITGAEMPWQIALKNAHYKTRGTEEPMAHFLSKSCYQKEEIERATRAAGWKDVKYVQKEAYLILGTDLG